MDQHHDDLTNRLRSLGRSPVPDETRERTLLAIRGRRHSERRWSRPAVAVAAMAGFFFGSLGLASAGALPDSVQDVAHDVLDHVGVDVPPGHDRVNDPTECPGGPYKNHGDFVKQNKGDNASSAAHSDCGKPVVSTQHSDENSNGTESSDTETDDQGQNGSHSNSSGGNDGKSDNSAHSSSADDLTTNSSTGDDKKSDSGPPVTPNANASNSSSGS